MSNGSSRIPGFYRLPVDERRRLLRLHADLSEQDMRTLDDGGIDTLGGFRGPPAQNPSTRGRSASRRRTPAA